MIEFDEQNRDANIFLLNAHTLLAWKEDFGGRIMYRIGENMVYAFVMVSLVMMVVVIRAMMMMRGGRIIMVMVGYKAMDQRERVREEGQQYDGSLIHAGFGPKGSLELAHFNNGPL